MVSKKPKEYSTKLYSKNIPIESIKTLDHYINLKKDRNLLSLENYFDLDCKSGEEQTLKTSVSNFNS